MLERNEVCFGSWFWSNTGGGPYGDGFLAGTLKALQGILWSENGSSPDLSTGTFIADPLEERSFTHQSTNPRVDNSVGEDRALFSRQSRLDSPLNISERELNLNMNCRTDKPEPSSFIPHGMKGRATTVGITNWRHQGYHSTAKQRNSLC